MPTYVHPAPACDRYWRSGNDLDMLARNHSSIVVANHHRELETLNTKPHVVFTDAPYAGGAVEGICQLTI